MLPGQAGLRTPGSATEIVLATRQGCEPHWKVASADAAAGVFAGNGGRVLAGPMDIPIRRRAIPAQGPGQRATRHRNRRSARLEAIRLTSISAYITIFRRYPII